MLDQCLKKVLPCTDILTGLNIGNPDFPFRNLSTEQPEPYIRFQPWDPPIIPSEDPFRFFTQGCISVCTSEISQEEADRCAERQAIICAGTPGGGTGTPNEDGGGGYGDPTDGGGGGGVPGGGGPGGGGGVPPPGTNPGGDGGQTPPPGGSNIYYSAEASCSVSCPDGTEFTKVVPAATFVDFTQARADKRAKDYACEQAQALKICLNAIDEDPICIWSEVSIPLRINGSNAPYTVSVTAGAIPSGLVMESNETGTVMTLTGQPSEVGVFDFTITATDKFGNTQTKDYQIQVVGILDEPPTLIDALINRQWQHSFSYGGPLTEPVLWSASGWPDGLAIDQDGLVSGIPTESGAFSPAVVVQDAAGHICINVYDLYVWDCTEEFTDVITASVPCKGGSDGPHNVPPAYCERVLSVTVTDMRLQCAGAVCNPTGWTIATVKLYDPDGNLDAQHSCANRAPFAFQIPGLHFTIPAQMLDESPNPYTIVFEVTNDAAPEPPGSCSGSVLFVVEGL